MDDDTEFNNFYELLNLINNNNLEYNNINYSKDFVLPFDKCLYELCVTIDHILRHKYELPKSFDNHNVSMNFILMLTYILLKTRLRYLNDIDMCLIFRRYLEIINKALIIPIEDDTEHKLLKDITRVLKENISTQEYKLKKIKDQEYKKIKLSQKEDKIDLKQNQDQDQEKNNCNVM